MIESNALFIFLSCYTADADICEAVYQNNLIKSIQSKSCYFASLLHLHFHHFDAAFPPWVHCYARLFVIAVISSRLKASKVRKSNERRSFCQTSPWRWEKITHHIAYTHMRKKRLPLWWTLSISTCLPHSFTAGKFSYKTFPSSFFLFDFRLNSSSIDKYFDMLPSRWFLFFSTRR